MNIFEKSKGLHLFAMLKSLTLMPIISGEELSEKQAAQEAE